MPHIDYSKSEPLVPRCRVLLAGNLAASSSEKIKATGENFPQLPVSFIETYLDHQLTFPLCLANPSTWGC